MAIPNSNFFNAILKYTTLISVTLASSLALGFYQYISYGPYENLMQIFSCPNAENSKPQQTWRSILTPDKHNGKSLQYGIRQTYLELQFLKHPTSAKTLAIAIQFHRESRDV